MLPCLNKLVFGFECMGCGGQRAAVLLVKGEFSAAFFMYPPIYSLIVLFGFLVLNFFVTFKYGKQVMGLLVIANVLILIASYLFKIRHFLF